MLRIGQYILGAVIFIILAYIITIVKNFLIKFSQEKLGEFYYKALKQFGWPFTVFISLAISIQFIDVSFIPKEYLFLVPFIFISYYALKVIQIFLDFFLKPKDEEFASIIKFTRNAITWIIWFVVIVLVLNNLGFNISTILTSFGILTIALAFTIQNILTDIFAYVFIHLDKPFKIGDFIVVGTESGTVRKIGLRSTRVLSLKGEELIFSNRKLTENVIHNYRRMIKRRKTFEIRVSQETSSEDLKKLLKEIKNIIEKEELTEIERVNFRDIEESVLIFEAVYYIKSSDYNIYMDVQENINFKIKEFLDKKNIKLV
ncbi:MAG TPA: mechanosensitive ion channel family protein [Candidatus Pacearchaeota archaeon]|nr:mechanosensitive ion channel family protein [Candidatus Pacearchaeota archaeon]